MEEIEWVNARVYNLTEIFQDSPNDYSLCDEDFKGFEIVVYLLKGYNFLLQCTMVL